MKASLMGERYGSTGAEQQRSPRRDRKRETVFVFKLKLTLPDDLRQRVKQLIPAVKSIASTSLIRPSTFLASSRRR
jgi:hypothetical protein